MDTKNYEVAVDILVFAAHPDDAELGCGGSIVRWVREGYKVGVVDFTRGELGTRGTPEIRLQEAQTAQKILGLTFRENLCFADGFFRNDAEHQLAVVRVIRKYRPKLLIINAPEDRHPDHSRAARLAIEAAFLSGLPKVKTFDGSEPQMPHRPLHYMHYIQDRWLTPNVVVDITPFWEVKMEAIKAYASQFYNPHSTEPETYISSPLFWDSITSRAMEMGRMIGVRYGEGYILPKPFPLQNLSSLWL